MAGVWIEVYDGRRGRSYRVRFRPGGREAMPRLAGTFKTRRDAEVRAHWIRGELAAMRVPDVKFTGDRARTLRDVAEGWKKSRIDASEGTRQTHEVNLKRILPVLGDRQPARITKADVQELVGALHERKLARESVRKTIATLAMILDHAEVDPNPARRVRLPEKILVEVAPPTKTHVLSAIGALPPAYRLPAVVLDATGMRVGELEALTWGDVDERERKWRVSARSAKTRRARWVPVPVDVFVEVLSLVPREDRDLGAQVFAGFGADRFRTALQRACKATGVPAFSPHDLRHRRATLWHLGGVAVAEAAGWLGHSATEHLQTYAHATLVDRSELDYREALTPNRVDVDRAVVAVGAVT